MTRSIALLAMLLVAGVAHATIQRGSNVRVELHSGQVVRGRVVSETTLGFLINTGSHSELVRFDAIANISEDGDDAAPAEPAIRSSPQPRARESVERDEEEPEDRRRVRFIAAAHAWLMPTSYGAWGSFGVDVGAAIEVSTRFRIHLLGNFTHVQNGEWTTNAVFVGAMAVYSFGVYGLGLAPVIGGGLVDRWLTFAVGVVASPVRLRFDAGQLTHELSLDGGIVYLSYNPRLVPFGRLAYTIAF